MTTRTPTPNRLRPAVPARTPAAPPARTLGRALALGAVLGLLPAVLPAAEQTQTVVLEAGWNAVWLEVDPVDAAGEAPAVEALFADPRVLLVATPLAPVGTAEFVADVTEASVNQAGWRVWRRVSPLAENTLAVVRGGRAYLVLLGAGADLGVDVTGEVAFAVSGWEPDSYNLLGFPVLPGATFGDFFGPSGGRHPTNRIFRLGADGVWDAVAASDVMAHGEAYWVFSDGPSAYAGPVAARFQSRGGRHLLDFGDGPGDAELPDPAGNPGDTILLTRLELTLSNVSGAPQPVNLNKVDPPTAGAAAADDDLRLYEVVPVPNARANTIGPNGQVVAMDAGSLLSGETRTVTLGAHRNWTSGAPRRENLYRLEFAHSYFWLPATAANPDLTDTTPGAPDPEFQGLWVGEVVVDAVSSITEPGSPMRPTTSKLPLRLIVHVDETGAASLLSHVMLMSTVTASEEVPPEVVLVVDEAKIPFFEGIETRGGKRVGRRIDSTTHDLPRRLAAADQEDLLDAVRAAFGLAAENEPSADQVAAYLDGQSARPVGLAETYHRRWALEGALGAGATVRTADDAPLHLDPFHRANPFRHAFHPAHVAGPAVRRVLTLTFDSRQQPGLLRGTYRESLTGLVNGTLEMRGRATFERVSAVGSLQ